MSGIETIDGATVLTLAGQLSNRTFEGVFTDGSGTSRAKFSESGRILNGQVVETVAGGSVTGHYNAKVPSIASTHRHSSVGLSGTPVNSSAGAGVTTNAVNAGATGNSATTAALFTAGNPSVGVNLPSLDTILNTPDSLNTTTTAAGVNNADLILRNTDTSNSGGIPGFTANTGSQSSTGNGLTTGTTTGITNGGSSNTFIFGGATATTTTTTVNTSTISFVGT